MVAAAKIVTILLVLALTAFTVSTIVLAVQKGNLSSQLDEAREKINTLEKITTPVIVDTTPVTTTEAPKPQINYRLPRNVKPTVYDLYIDPDVTTGKFSGYNVISLNIIESTKTITLHSHLLTITKVKVLDGETEIPSTFELEKVREFLIVDANAELAVSENRYKLRVEFNGKMDDKIIGLYSSSYLKPDGSKKTIATSKFEPTFARQSFPCFDEPDMKAIYKVTLVTPIDGGYHALSNMPQSGVKDIGDGLKEVTFVDSVAMSTYLSAFIVSDFDYLEGDVRANGVGEDFKMRVYATPEQKNKMPFALETGVKITEYYINYFQVEYPLPKLDMAAIPDFVSGAMETWGLVTFRETSLLYDDKISSTANRQRVATVIAHEVAHMWFGNLVTMKWWNELWLNEGFASYIEYKGTDCAFPDWQMLDQFAISTLHGVLSLDATLGAHPIVQTVENPDQITEIFDTITYSKGSSIIRMLEDFIGPKIFQKSVTKYLTDNKFGNTETSDFLDAIAAQPEVTIDVREIMRTWTEQMGLPVVKVEKISPTKFKLTQKRFFSNPEDYKGTYDDSVFNYKWSIPITFRTDLSSEVQRYWYMHNDEPLEIELPVAPKWIKFNSDQYGYYRVDYDTEMWDALKNSLITDLNVFTVGDRASILNDAFSLADATTIPYETALDMTKYLKDETEYVTWSVASSKLTSLKTSLMFTDIYKNYISYARNLIDKVYKDVGWNVEGVTEHIKNRKRVNILSAACSLGVEDCLKQASDKFMLWIADKNFDISSDIRELVYYYGMFSTGSEQIWETVLERFVNEPDAQEKNRLMYGLSAVQVPWLLQRYIELAWDERYVRSQDYFSCLQNIAANRVGESLVWHYVRENWVRIVERFTLNERYLGSMIPSITGRFDSQTRLSEMEAFFELYPEAGAGEGARVRAKENVKNNIQWLENNKENIAQWLEKNKA
ncbi:ENPEP.2 family protein [Megaselia abdita]